jgi:hypothetical protein
MKKHYFDDFEFEAKTPQTVNTSLAQEQRAGGFRCSHCRRWVVINPYIGTANRNHCNFCLWSRHVDIAKGDRMADCRGGMQPIALTFKHEGYGRHGEIMLVHLCKSCEKVSINRIAGDDYEPEILHIFEGSSAMDNEVVRTFQQQGIEILTQEDRDEVQRQLFGVQ